MKKIILILSLIFMASGCEVFKPSKALTVDESIQQIKKCEEAGLKAKAIHSFSGFSGDEGIVRIDCEPKE